MSPRSGYRYLEPEALARVMLRLLQDDALRESLGRTGRARAVADYSLEAMVAAHEQVFARALASRPGRRADEV